MASEDNFLCLDSEYYYDDIQHHIVNGDLNRDDILDFLSEGRISVKKFVEYVGTFDWLEE